YVLQAGVCTKPHETLLVVVAFVPDPSIVPPIKRPDRRKHVAEGVRNGEPEQTTGLQDACELGGSDFVVVEVLEDCDRARASKRRVRKGKTLGSADRPLGDAVDSLLTREAACCEHAGLGEIAADGADPLTCRLDHRRTGPADADVEVGTATVFDSKC